MKKWVFAIFLAVVLIGCQRYQPPADSLKSQEGQKTQEERKQKVRKRQNWGKKSWRKSLRIQ